LIIGGIKHRPFGAWADEEDKLEAEAELNTSKLTQDDVRGKTWNTKQTNLQTSSSKS
tara:strand:- start:361 stop:531 length:171 start_codon:yes stop_codon:yes gene_type:complete